MNQCDRTLLRNFVLRIAAAIAVSAALGAPAFAADREFVYRTVAGDTLIGIAKRFMVDPEDWQLLQKRNRVADPRAIPVGTAIRMPVERMRAEPRPIKVEAIRGEAKTASGALAAGTTIQEGTEVATGKEGFVTLQLADGSRIAVPAGSKVRIERSRSYGNASVAELILRLLGGRVEAIAGPQGDADLFQIQFDRTTTSVRGTKFRVAALEGGAVASEVLEGRVGVNEESVNKPVDIAGGFGTKVLPGQAPLPPIRLLAAPDVSRVPALVERTLVKLPFGAVDGARAYRAQVSQDAGFNTVLAESLFDAPEAKFAELADGDYFLRVRAADALGLEGLNAVRGFKLKARPEPPFVSTPPDKSKSSAEGAKTSWSASLDAAAYRLQVSARPDFSVLAIDEPRLAATSVEVGARLGPGTWHWRVASVRADNDQGPWGDPRSFTIVPDPPAPKSGQMADGRLSFEWSGEPGQRFQFQFARDRAFSRIEIDRMLDEPKVVLDKPDAGEFFFRIRAVEPDGFRGPFSPAQRGEVEVVHPWWLPLLLLLLL